ncbi:MAG: ArsA-related P-loop ATPase [Bdellovibrionota bacterium]
MITLLPSTKTLICIGSGGVGKTTMAASIGVGQASSGKKVLVLTIDPSLRLAQALGIKTDGELHQVNLASDSKGELWSCIINHKKTFEWFIRSAADKDSDDTSGRANIEALLQNKLYQQLSGRLSGSQEFTSLISLYRFVSSNKFDLVILDTPPSQHTWNFLRAPEKISALFNEGVASWFRQNNDQPHTKKSVLKKMFNLKILSYGTTQVLKALEVLTGSYFMKELSAFFEAVQKWQGPLENYVMSCHRLLISAETEFVLVTALDSSRITEAQKLSREIQKQGYRLSSVIINRIPSWTHAQKNAASNIRSPRVNELIKYYLSLENDLQSRLKQLRSSLKVYKCFELRQNSENVKDLQKTYNNISSAD